MLLSQFTKTLTAILLLTMLTASGCTYSSGHAFQSRTGQNKGVGSLFLRGELTGQAVWNGSDASAARTAERIVKE